MFFYILIKHVLMQILFFGHTHICSCHTFDPVSSSSAEASPIVCGSAPHRCCQGGQLDTMLVCSFIAHFHILYVRLAGRRAEPAQMAGLARDELLVTFCQDKWTKQCVAPIGHKQLRSGCMMNCQTLFLFNNIFKQSWLNVLPESSTLSIGMHLFISRTSVSA